MFLDIKNNLKKLYTKYVFIVIVAFFIVCIVVFGIDRKIDIMLKEEFGDSMEKFTDNNDNVSVRYGENSVNVNDKRYVGYNNIYSNQGNKEGQNKLKNREKNNKLSVADIKKMIDKANINQGKRIVRKCVTCHNLTEKKHYIGPHLVAVINREKGSKELGYNFSKVLKDSEGVWSDEDLFNFIYAPKDYLPGTKMIFYGIKKHQDIGDVIAYVKYLDSAVVGEVKNVGMANDKVGMANDKIGKNNNDNIKGNEKGNNEISE